MSKDRVLLTELIKNWVQSHSAEYKIVDQTQGDPSLRGTTVHFSWLIREMSTNVDLVSLLDAMESYVIDIRQHNKIDGMFCCKCGRFSAFAEANQEDGSMICYCCRQNPYV